MAQGVEDGLPGGAPSIAHEPRLEALTGVLSVVAVRLLQMKDVARSEPDRPARRWRRGGTWRCCGRCGARPASSPWAAGRFFRELAKLGGFLGRKGDGEPGWNTIWRGWEKLHLMLRGTELADRLDL